MLVESAKELRRPEASPAPTLETVDDGELTVVVFGVVDFTGTGAVGVVVDFRVGVVVFPVGVVVLVPDVIDIFCFGVVMTVFSGVSSRKVTFERRLVDALCGVTVDEDGEEDGAATGDASVARDEFRR